LSSATVASFATSTPANKTMHQFNVRNVSRKYNEREKKIEELQKNRRKRSKLRKEEASNLMMERLSVWEGRLS